MSKPNGQKAAESPIRFLPCQVGPGMFRGELLVYLKGYDPENPGERIKVQMLVDEKEVEGLRGEPKRNQPVDAWVKVTLTGESKGRSRVILPQPAQPVGESMLVDAGDVRAKPGG
jgi:hypothetical protein